MNDQDLALLKRIFDETRGNHQFFWEDELDDSDADRLINLIHDGYASTDEIAGYHAFLTDKGKEIIGVKAPENQERLF